jgi:protein subunit release factor A
MHKGRSAFVAPLRQGAAEATMESIVIEIRAAEGGADAKLLVKKQLGAYERAAALHEL